MLQHARTGLLGETLKVDTPAQEEHTKWEEAGEPDAEFHQQPDKLQVMQGRVDRLRDEGRWREWGRHWKERKRSKAMSRVKSLEKRKKTGCSYQLCNLNLALNMPLLTCTSRVQLCEGSSLCSLRWHVSSLINALIKGTSSKQGAWTQTSNSL